MDLRNINELGYAAFGQLLDGKADFRILQCEGIVESFSRASLERIFQLPYGLDINSNKEYLSFVKVIAQSGKYGPSEKYIFVMGYRFAGVDKNKRKNYYGACVAYKYTGYVIDAAELLSYLTMVLDLSKSLIVENLALPLKLQEFRGEKREVLFNGLSPKNQYVIPALEVSERIRQAFIEFNYSYPEKLSGMHRLVIALGTEKIQGISPLEIKGIETHFDRIAAGEIDLFAENEIKYKEPEEAENNKIMIENKNDFLIDEAIDSRLKPVIAKLEGLDKRINEKENQSVNRFSIKSLDKVFLSLVVILLIVLFFILREVVSINILTKPAQQQADPKTVKEIERLVLQRIDSLNQAKNQQNIIYIAGKNENLGNVASKFNVSPGQITNKNSQIKAGDTLIIKK